MNKTPELPSNEKKPRFNFITCGTIGIIALLATANAVVFGAPNIIPQELLQQISLDQLQGVIAIIDIAAVGFTASILSGSFL